MKWLQTIWQRDVVRVPLCCAAAAGGGFLLSIGTVSGVASPLAAAVAGVCPPLYAFAILLGGLVAYTATDMPEGMQFLLICLVAVTCLRILFRDRFRPHGMAIMTAFGCAVGGFTSDLIFHSGGMLPLYLLAALMTGVAAFFLADAAETLREQRRIAMKPAKSFTFATCYLLMVTALCGVDLSFCNVGRALGTALTLLCARQLRQHGGTLCGALTACGITLCSVKLGMPMLFLPVTAMLMGFLSKLPNALFIPVFFLIQALSSAVLDSSMGLAKVLIELVISCTVYGLCGHVELERFIITEVPSERGGIIRQERFLSETLHELHEETAAVMRRLTIPEPEDATLRIRCKVCVSCQNHDTCWKQQAEQMHQAFRQLLHTPQRMPSVLQSCIRRTSLMETASVCAMNNALSQMQRVHMLQNRSITLEYLLLLENMACDAAKRRSESECIAETNVLRQILQRCACAEAACYVRRLRSGRYTAEIYTQQEEFPLNSVMELLSAKLGIGFGSMLIRQDTGSRICLYQEPPYSLEYEICSVNAPDHVRCGDQADAFTDGKGNQYLVLSDGMGSGSTASLASRIAVRTLRRMICSEMPPETAIRLVNTLLLSETNTENFATLDVLILDADSGELTLYKSGAAATLFCRRGQVQRVASQSFPVGIVPDAMPSRQHLTAYSQDCIVMLSDGIGEAEYPYISQLLRQGISLTDLTRAVCEKAGVFLGGTARDDMTVIAARICSQIPSDLTNFVTNKQAKNGNIAVEASI